MYDCLMNQSDTSAMGISDARANLTEVVNQVRLLGKPVTLTRRDKPQAVIVPVEFYERAVAALGTPQA